MKTIEIPCSVENYRKYSADGATPEVKTRDGRKARVICTDRSVSEPIIALVLNKETGKETIESYCASGCDLSNRESAHDLFIVIPPKLIGWYNCYHDNSFGPFPSREIADSVAELDRLACIEVYEGDGLDK